METATDIRLPALHRYPDAITVEFVDGRVYLYNYEVPGQRHVERMKSLAAAGHGLSSYISRHIGKRFAARLR